MAKVSKEFESAIKLYLDKRAISDPLFAKNYVNPTNSIGECCQFILGEVQKSGQCGFDNEEIYGMAVHYYDEENIKVEEVKGECSIVVDHHVDLSEEEIAEAKKKAMDKVMQEQCTKLRGTPKQAQVNNKPKVEQPTLFDSMF